MPLAFRNAALMSSSAVFIEAAANTVSVFSCAIAGAAIAALSAAARAAATTFRRRWRALIVMSRLHNRQRAASEPRESEPGLEQRQDRKRIPGRTGRGDARQVTRG